jgi:signal transduction histidine kinase/CheY-like chemotaxis protein
MGIARRGLFAAPADAAPLTDQALLADQYRSLYGQMLPSLMGNTLGLAIFMLVYWPHVPHAKLAIWAACIVALTLWRAQHYLRFARQPEASDAQILAWSRSWRVPLHCQALAWAAGIWMFYGAGGHFQLIALIVLTYCYCLAAIHLLTLVPKDLWLFLSLVLLSLIINMARDTGRPYSVELAGVLCVLYLIALVMGRTYHRTLRDAIMLKVRTERLAEQLRVEKGLADEARRSAEAASHAKTQFFAAASHDLRQPLHALGLFAEALRQRTHEPEAAKLINSINESVDALEGLFGELLDITRIDTGGVDVAPKPVPLRELFARLRLQFEPVAFEKGLMLSFHGDRHVLHTDPVIVERILRNLVSNALRYSEDGGVLVSCRPRDGQLLLQVWDSGIGIAPAALNRIFDEFYQVQSQRPLQAHHRKGLGLGLAIVKRLAALLQAPLTVRSQVGHGTVFGLLLPLGRQEQPAAGSLNIGKAPLGLTLDSRLIVVVEDEPAVSEGLVVLLQAWGAEVLAFDSVAAVTAWARATPSMRPDLMLVDYRLPDALTGIDALRAVRAVHAGQGAEPIPAIMVTGSTMTGHEVEAQQHDFHVLIKPVVPNKLRAMIAFKLGVR